MSADANPYATPSAELGTGLAATMPTSEATMLRKAHLNHEASVRSIGLLYYLSAGLLGLALWLPVLMLQDTSSELGSAAAAIAVSSALCAALILLGHNIRKLRRGVRPFVGILAGIGLFGFPMGTLINAYILYLVFSRKGRFVFSDEYQRIIEQTPEIRYRTPLAILILGGLLLALLLIGALTLWLNS